MDVLAVRLSSRPLSIFVVSLLIAAAAIPQGTSAAHKKTVDQKLREESTLSTFSNLIHNNLIANHTFEVRQATIFAPTNDAFDRYPKDIEGNVVLYHMTNLAQTLDQLKDSLSSELDGNPPLWVTRQKSPDGKEDIYINNAKIIRDRSNYLAKNTHSKNQVLHVLDEVLEPVTSSVPDSPIYNPDAFLFLDKFENLELEHRLRSFRQRVQQNNKADIFKAEGRHTFFIPVDEGFKPPPRPEKIDQKVIDGHVIPNRVLFTRATPCDEDYETLAFGDNLRVTISFTVQPDGKGSKLYVKSNTIVGDPNHATGVVLAEIVKANIPVKNGVVHLIHRPLMVVDTTVKQFLEGIGIEKEDGPLYRFYEMIVDHGSEFMTKITKLKSLTLFAPSNSAWNNSNLNNLIHNKEKMMEILNLHLVEQRLSLDDIKDNNMKQLFQVETAAKRKNLYFNILTSNENNITLTVEGGGVNATVIQPNIAATNGLVHIIDRVLGVPYTTVYQKLETDPMLNKTFHLGQQERFNEQLNDTRKRFTYFVPRDSAWEKAEIHSPSAHKKLFMKEFSYHVKQILERHLVVDHAYNMADLMKIANSTVVLPTVRDVLKIRVKEIEKSYYLEWQGERIHVFRPDVECTNGVIHVIDSALLKESDVIVTGGSMPSSLLLSPLSFLAQLVPLFIVKFLL